MAHEIRKTDNFGEVRGNGKRAWHGLGIEIEEGLSAVQGFRKIGLDWKNTLAPVFAKIEGMGPDGEATSKETLLPDHRAHIRLDTGMVHGIVSKGYVELDNMDLARFADTLGEEAGVKVETAGSLFDGRRVFACVKMPEIISAVPGDLLESYVLLSNGHGGTAGFNVYPTSVRVVCANTLRWSERDAARGLSFIHLGGSMEERLKLAKTALGRVRKETAKFEFEVEALVKSEISAEEVVVLMREIYDATFGKIGEGLEKKARLRLEKKRETVLDKWAANLENERNALDGMRGTRWAAYNAISEWHDHERGFAGAKTAARMNSNVYGASHTDKVKAYRRVLASV